MAGAGAPSPPGEAAELGCFAAARDVKREVKAAAFFNRESQRDWDVWSRSMCAVSHTCLGWKCERKLQICCLAHRL